MSTFLFGFQQYILIIISSYHSCFRFGRSQSYIVHFLQHAIVLHFLSVLVLFVVVKSFSYFHLSFLGSVIIKIQNGIYMFVCNFNIFLILMVCRTTANLLNDVGWWLLLSVNVKKIYSQMKFYNT